VSLGETSTSEMVDFNSDKLLTADRTSYNHMVNSTNNMGTIDEIKPPIDTNLLKPEDVSLPEKILIETPSH